MKNDSINKLAQSKAKKLNAGKNKPGPLDDIVRAAGALKRTVYSNPGNKNKSSNIDKWLRGGKYNERPFSQFPGDVVKGVKGAARGADWLVRKATPLPDR